VSASCSTLRTYPTTTRNNACPAANYANPPAHPAGQNEFTTMSAMLETATTTGHVTQVIGSTFDAEFPEDRLPEIYNAVTVDQHVHGIHVKVTGEVQQHLGGGRVRCVALGNTDGMVRGKEVVDTGAPLSVPVGKETLSRVFNLLGEPIDNRGPVVTAEKWPIHRDPPSMERLSSKTEVF